MDAADKQLNPDLATTIGHERVDDWVLVISPLSIRCTSLASLEHLLDTTAASEVRRKLGPNHALLAQEMAAASVA